MMNVSSIPCPICEKQFSMVKIDDHVNRCLFLNSAGSSAGNNTAKRQSTNKLASPSEKKTKITETPRESGLVETTLEQNAVVKPPSSSSNLNIPLAEQMRPDSLEEYIGQKHVLGDSKMLKLLLDKNDIPSMILWGPPGCGKTSLANVIASTCKKRNNMRFVKLSATMAGINDVKEVVKVAKNEIKFKRQTILFMDEIHRFNKLQQDAFLPHVENGTIILIGATTENPSFSLNTALLSRCRVIVLEKLSSDNILDILMRSLKKHKLALVVDPEKYEKTNGHDNHIARVIVEKKSLHWLAEISDGDARVALSSLQLALQAKDPGDQFEESGATIITLDDIKDGIKRSHILYDKKGEEHYNMISALHKSIRASDDNAALYWLTRMLEGGEDPIYIARRMIRMAGEDIGLADPQALPLTVACMQGCQSVGMPECDVLLAECAVYLARATKSQEVYGALGACKRSIREHKGALPSVPLHLRNAPTKLMTQLGYGKGYNMKHKDESNLEYMPEGMEEINFFENL